MIMVSWRDTLKSIAEEDKITNCTISEKELDREFDPDYGMPEGKPFWAWSDKYVYFTCCYDGREWVDRVPRHPRKDEPDKPEHVGGY